MSPHAISSPGSRSRRRIALSALAALTLIATILPLAPAAQAAGNQGIHLAGTAAADQYVTMGASPGLRSSTFTVELWFKQTGAGVAASTGSNGVTAVPLITKGTADGETAPQDINYFLGIDATGKLVGDFEQAQNGGTPSSNNPITGPTTITMNVWHHAAATYDGTTWRLYLDGVADGTSAPGQPANIAVTSATAIGTGLKNDGSRVGYFAGDIDEARIWSSVRSQAQIQAGMNTEIGAASGLLGVWHMNEGSGTTTADAGGSNFTGTLANGATWVAGAPALDPVTPPTGNKGIHLAGTAAADQYVTMGASPGLRSSTFTVELWFKQTGAGVAASTGSNGVTAVPLITKGTADGETAPQDINYFLGIDATGKLVGDFEQAQNGGTPSSNNPITGPTTITMNVWHHAAATYDGTTWRLYLDGVADGTSAPGQPANIAVTSATAIGTGLKNDGSRVGYFAGDIDEARIWSSVRSQAQIQAGMNTEIGAASGLLGVWHMNEGSGTTTADAGGSNFTGTLANGATWVAGAPALDPVTPPTGNKGIHLAGTAAADQYVTMGASPGLRSSTFTVELWFKRTGAGVGDTTGTGGILHAIPLITKGTADGETAPQDFNYFLGIDADTNTLMADFEEAQSGSIPGQNHPISGSTVITSNVWHHAAATYDGTTWHLYLDGAADGSLSVGQPANIAVTSATAIGTGIKNSGATAGYFQGDVDEARIWNTARTQAQIQATMNTEIGAASGLLGVWHMNEGSGTTTADAGGSNFTGTLANGATWVDGTPFEVTTPPSSNTAVQFDGTNDQIDLGNGLGATQFTLELWFKRTGAGTATSTSGSTGGLTSVIPLITKGRSQEDASNLDINYFLGIDSASGKLAADFEEGATGTSPGLNHGFIANTVVTQNTWHHAAVTYDGSVFRIYLDGVLDGTSPAINQPPRSDSIQKVGLGVAFNTVGADGAFAGVIDEARIWNSARSLAQIQGTMNLELTSGSGLIGRWGLNDGSGNTAAASVGPNGTLVNGPTWVAGAPALNAVGAAPAAPMTVSPADGATGVTVPATLDVTATDADSNDLTVTFYGRPHATTPGPDFTIVAIPDTQFYSQTASLWPIFTAQTQWIVNTQNSLNTVFATHLGDVGQSFDTIPVEYQRASQSMAILDNNGVKNGVLPGNHEFASNGSSSTASLYDQYFPPSRYQGFNWYGGYLGDPNDGIADGGVNRLNKDNYELFSASGMDFLIIHLENDMPSYATAWAQNVINAYPNRKVIVSTHAFIDANGNRGTAPVSRADGQSAQAVWNSLISPNCQIFMVLNGHYHGEGRRTDPNACGQPVFQLNSDYQDDANGGDGWLRYYTFKPSQNTIDAYTYSPTRNNGAGDFDTTNGGRFTLSWPMSSGAAYTEIGSVTGVTSGADASIQWDGLGAATQYDWYATVSDGSHLTTGATQSFTTEVPPPTAPVVDSATIDQAHPRTNDTLTVSAQSHDVNGDTVTYTYQWLKNGLPISGASSASLNLAISNNGDSGDQISVQVTGHDGALDSAPVTSPTVTIENSLPTATVELTPLSPRPNQVVTATATRADLDQNDAVTLSFVWKLNGSIVKTTSATPSLTDTIDPAGIGATSGDTLRVEVTPNDGTAAGALAAASVSVYAPTVAVLPNSTYQVNGKVNAMIRVGNRVYIGGDFTALLGHNGEVVTRLNLAALDAETGDPVAWDPSADGAVLTLAASPDGSTIYAGGTFKHLGTLTRTRLAAIDATSGTVLPWAPSASLTVQAIVASASTVYVGGRFQNLTGQARAGLGAIDASTGAILPGWTPSANGTPDRMLMTPDGRVIVAGAFTTINNSSSQYLAALDATDGTLLPWAAHPPAVTEGLAMGAGELFVGVDTNPSGNQVFAYDLGTGQQRWIGTGDGDALALTFLDGVVYVGGHFSNMAGQQRKNLAAFDPVTGTLRDWTTSVNTGIAVLSMTSGGHKLYIGGGFTEVNGVPQQRYAVFAGPPTASSPPVTDSVVIDQSTPGTGDTLSATVTAHDDDGDALSYAYQWTRNGADISGATQPTLDLSLAGNGDKNDEIRVRVMASDGSSTSPAVTSPAVTISNTAPAASVALDNRAPGTDAMLTATVTRSDADNDAVSLTYLWTVNGVTKRTTVTTALTDAFDLSVLGNGDPDDVIVITVTPNDGTVNGTAAVDTATVRSDGVPPIFSDDIGSLNGWSVTRIVLDNSTGSPTAPSALAQVSGQSAFATHDLDAEYDQVCISTNIKVSSGNTFDVLRLLSGTGGKIIKLSLNASNQLILRSEFVASSNNTKIVLGTGWHNVEMCGTVGTATKWDLYRDGVKIVDGWQANTGTSGVGRIQIGDKDASTITANFDHVVLDRAPGDSAVADTEPPTVPGTPNGSSTSPGSITISWAASTDQTLPITYRIYRDGVATAIDSTQNTSYNDSGLAGGSSHTYTIDALDGLNHASAKSSSSASIAVMVGSPTIFSEDFTTGDFSGWTSTDALTIDNANGSPSAPSARGSVSGQSASAYVAVSVPAGQMCASTNVNVTSGSNFDLLRLLTADNGKIIKVSLNPSGKLIMRSEFSMTTVSSKVSLGTGAWHSIELCGTVGTVSMWDLYLDGTKIMNAIPLDTGDRPIGRVQIGDIGASTFVANWDHVILSQVLG